MKFLLDALGEGWRLVITGDPSLYFITRITLQVAGIATVVALVLGLPIGVVLGTGRFRGRGALLVIANSGLGLPPIVVGLVLTVLMYPAGPLGRLHLLYTLHGVYVAQTILALPIIVALTASAVRDLPDGLLDQARAYGAGRWRIGILALREARIGVLAATIAALGSGLSEVGAVILVGGNSIGYTETLASAALTRFEGGNLSSGLAIGIVLLALILLTTSLLTWLQYGRRTRAWVKAS